MVVGDFPRQGGHARIHRRRKRSIVNVVFEQKCLCFGIDAADQSERLDVVPFGVHAIRGPIVDDDDDALVKQAFELARLDANLWKSSIARHAQDARCEAATGCGWTFAVSSHVDRRRITAFAPVASNDAYDFSSWNDARRLRRRDDDIRLIRGLRRQPTGVVLHVDVRGGRLFVFFCGTGDDLSTRTNPLGFGKDLHGDQVAVDGAIHRRASAQQYAFSSAFIHHVRLERVIPRRSNAAFDQLSVR